MVRARFMLSLAAMFVVLAASAAQAADYPQPPPPPQYIPPPPQVQDCCDSWYLRGFVGIGINKSYDIQYLPAPANVGNGFAFDQHSMADTFFLGGAVGYEWNNWLRFDVSGEYRARTQVNARGVYDHTTGQGDSYQGYLKSWVFLANAFVDLGTWNCFTPFVGAGVGGAYNQLADFVDMGIGQTGAGFGRNTAEWHFAYALYAGVGYNVTKNLKIDFTYRYLNYGSVTDTIDCIGSCNADSYKFKNLYSNDFMLGLRWTCCDTAPPPPRYVYQPQPYVPPPPLRSRG